MHTTIWITVIIFAQIVAKDDAVKAMRKDYEKDVARINDEYEKIIQKLELERRQKINKIKTKYADRVEKKKRAAARKGDLDLALAWRDFLDDLDTRLVNFALKAKVEVSAQTSRNGAVRNLNDGKRYVPGSPIFELRPWWFAGDSPRQWAAVVLDKPRRVTKVQIEMPLGTRLVPGGHEPLDYEIVLEDADRKPLKKFTVRGGKHPRVQFSKDKKVILVIFDLKVPVVASRVVFRSTRTNASGSAPFLFEFEVLGER